MAKKWLLGSGAALVLAVAAGGAWIGGAFKVPGPFALAARGDAKAAMGPGAGVALEFAPREVVQPVLAHLPRVVEFSGPLVAPQSATVRAKAGGTLLALNVAEGSRVHAGEVLGRIDVADLASRVAERRANLEAARAALSQAERTQTSNESLATQNFISPIALENSRAALATARANFNAAQAALAATQVGLRDGTLMAPISGIVAKRLALAGEKVSPEQPVLTIVDLRQLELAGNVGTHEVSRLSAGMPVTVQVEGVSQPVPGRIARIAPSADPGTRSIGVAISLTNTGETLRAGQYALARVTLADDVERLTLPANAIGNSAGQDLVWLIENGTLARRAVLLGRRDSRAGRVEVLQGVDASSIVLAVRFDNLREGAKAVVVVDKSAPVASAAASAPLVK
jgi:membrane fusion protein, multidrug efflux system